MFKKNSPHLRAVFQAVFVTFLWSTSWVLIKFGLKDIPALTFAGLRYVVASAIMIPFTMRKLKTASFKKLTKGAWLQLFALGFFLYTVTQGAQFLSLFYLPAITTNLLLSFSAVAVAILGIFTLNEHPTKLQWGGIILYLAGVLVYFYPAALPANETIGFFVAIVGVAANVLSSIIGRNINRAGQLDPIIITTFSMGFGSIILLASGLFLHGFPQLSLLNWVIILWLAVVNSAFAFTLWNITLQTLSAAESSIINSLMLVQIPILAYIFLGERLTVQEIVGLVIAGLGILIVQLRKRRRKFRKNNKSGK